MQPLDIAFIGPSKTYYAQEVEQWIRSNPGRVITVYQIGELFGRAYMKAATAEAAANDFR
jgi:cellobiose-specific phosphotransferase system component IIB